ncbi:MAG TPA: uridine diphosphate-N-acetylglucosamine-binding protein YvcK [Actinomycetota bacterium]|nr:uridine diphosphate-N-acetylglucosamine-binding protein YvcK [Actinomycetota bacterium]
MTEPRIVCIGGGHGLSAALGAARQLTEDVTAVVTVADDGGSSGVLRDWLRIPAPGDLRMAIAALAGDPSRAALLQYRFSEGDLAGHPLGNLIIAALADLRGDFVAAVDEVAQIAGVSGRVLPATPDSVRLRARMGGLDIRGQVAIATGPGPVEHLTLEPADAAPTPDAVEAIEASTLTVLGPGSLFTSVLAALLVPGIGAAVRNARRVALVLNAAQQIGETAGLDAAGHIRALFEHVPGLRIDAVLVHDGPLPGVARPVVVAEEALAAMRAPVIGADLIASGARHDPDKLAAALKGLL